jgi:large subunit ribosomal protein L4
MPPPLPPTEVARVRASPPVLITSLPVVSLATGEPTGARVAIDGAIAGAPHRPDIVHRVIVWQEKNARTTLYMGKSRAEVRGGGIKPWKQKGTGKARAGSIRSPLWIGGGVAHPPKLREWGIGLQKAVRRAGMRIALSAKLRDGRITVVASLELPGGSAKTRDAAAALAAHGCEGRRTLLIADDGSVPAPLASALSNISRTTLLPAIGANVAAIVMADRVFVTPEGLATLTARITQKL